MALTTNLSFEKYRAMDGVSASDIYAATRTARDFLKLKTGQTKYDPEAPHFVLGTMVHALVLEPGSFYDLYCIEPSLDDEGQALRQPAKDGSMRLTKQAKAFLESFNEKNKGKLYVTAKMAREAHEMKEAVMRNSAAVAILKDMEPEVSLTWTHGNVKCKGRPDGVAGSTLVDLKHTRDITPSAFTTASYRLGYHQKEAWYKWGFEQNGVAIDDIKLIVVAGDECIVRPMLPELIERGHEQNMRALARLSDCIAKNEFPGWPEEIPLGFPAWAAIDMNEDWEGNEI